MLRREEERATRLGQLPERDLPDAVEGPVDPQWDTELMVGLNVTTGRSQAKGGQQGEQGETPVESTRGKKRAREIAEGVATVADFHRDKQMRTFRTYLMVVREAYRLLRHDWYRTYRGNLIMLEKIDRF